MDIFSNKWYENAVSAERGPGICFKNRGKMENKK